MIVKLHLRRRATLSEAIPMVNARLVEELRQVPGFWNPEKSAADVPLDLGGDDSVGVGVLDLREVLVAGLTGQTVYLPRSPYWMEGDTARGDDALLIRIDSSKADYARFCWDIMPRLIAA